MSSDLGIIGLGTMGANLALNFNSKGFKVAVYNRTASVTDEFISKNRRDGLKGFKQLSEFCSDLSTPRVILIMVTAGKPVDAVIDSLLPYLSDKDIVIDAGNSYYKDTQRRYRQLKERAVRFAGIGVSGGEEGALKGPSIMAGCDTDAWQEISYMLSSIAARDFEGSPCAARLGSDGAGHFVKTIHNGIEYVILQLIAESYMLLKSSGMDNLAISDYFARINSGLLRSYLLGIASDVLKKKEDGKYLVDLILDKAEQKGTGIWAAQSALELGVPAYSIAVAPMVRSMSSLKEQRVLASSKLRKETEKIEVDASQLTSAILAAEVAAYSEGFSIISSASKEYSWMTELAEVARVWQGGCIIRSELLRPIRKALKSEPEMNILLDDHIFKILNEALPSLRQIVSIAASASLPLPAFSSTLQYLETYFTDPLPTNLVQALRDYFGAHGYRRTDREGSFHTDWRS
ncbi:MAG: NADP-dependent phosphogluconate dehydrogenase [Conexivisphaerales archaeon]